MRKIIKKKRWNLTKIIFTIIVILLFIGVVTIIATGNVDKLSILWKTP